MPASDIEVHEAWNAKVAQVLFEAAEKAAMGFIPEHEIGWGEGEKGEDIVTLYVFVTGPPPE